MPVSVSYNEEKFFPQGNKNALQTVDFLVESDKTQLETDDSQLETDDSQLEMDNSQLEMNDSQLEMDDFQLGFEALKMDLNTSILIN